jgi:hypothetical protein
MLMGILLFKSNNIIKEQGQKKSMHAIKIHDTQDSKGDTLQQVSNAKSQ